MGRERRFANPEVALTLSRAFRKLRSEPADQGTALGEINLVADQIAQRRIPVKGLAQSLGIGTTTLHRWFGEIAIKLATLPGRLPNPEIQSIRDRVFDFRCRLGIKCGYKHTTQSIALPDEPPPYHVVYEILRAALPPVQRPVRHHDHLFVAKYVDYLWHTPCMK
jgi:hypothetical protein